MTDDATATLTLTYAAIDLGRLDRMRERGADEFGNPWTLRTAEGWEPLRCCLRLAGAGEAIALICHTPWTEPSPWAEAGPVFVHHDRCDGYADTAAYPEALRGEVSILNPFDHTGARAYHHITRLGPDDDPEQAVRRVMAEPDVAYLHVRSCGAGCFTFAVLPAGAPAGAQVA